MKNRLTTLDEQIKKALEQMEAPSSDARWEEMEQLLDQTFPADTPDAVDAMAFSRLNDLDVGNKKANWDLFEEKLEASENELLDETAYNKLESIETPYRPEHWPLMEQRLESAFSFRQKLVRYKVAEIALMLLLIFTLVQYLPLGQQKIRKLRLQQPEKPTAVIPVEKSASSVLAEVKALPEILVAEINSQQIRLDATLPDVLDNRGIRSVGLLPNIGSTTRPVDKLDRPVALLDDGGDDLPPHMKRSLVPSDPALAAIAMEESKPVDPKMDQQQVGLMPTLKFSIDNGEYENILVSKSLSPNQNSRLTLGMFGAVDYNYIQTPFDEVFQTGPYTVDSVGYSGGVSIALDLGRWEIETGGIYSFKKYRPLVPVQQFGTFDYLVVESFESISLDILEIPVNAHVNLFPDDSKWQVYGLAGVSANLIMKPLYSIRTDALVSNKNALALPSPQEIEEIGEKSRLNNKDFPEGILAGGSFADNSFFRLNLGVGIERSLGARVNLFLQPTYQHQFKMKGFGPNDDRIDSFSFRFGTKVSIW